MGYQKYSKFVKASERYEELEAWLGTPDALRDLEVYRAKVTEWKNLEETVLTYRSFLQIESQIEDARELLNSSDTELLELAKEELSSLQTKREEVEHSLDLLLIPKNPNDEKNVIIEIRACAGGEEAALFAADLYRMYMMFATRMGYKIDLLNANETELGGFREIDFMLIGKGAYSKMKYESGVHRVQRIPVTESNGKLQTSTVTVAVLPEVEEVSITINPQDVKIESCKSSGAGGQHINKTESAVRLTHIPTGIVVECQEQRSQLKNREKAMMMLKAKLYHIQETERSSQIASDRREQVGTGDRSERIRTYNFPQNRVTDHRIGLTLYQLDHFINGEIDEIIKALASDEMEKAIRGTEQ